MIDSAACTNNRVAMRPRNRQARVEVVVPRNEKEIRAGAIAARATGGKIEWHGSVVNGVQSIEVVVAEARRDGQIGRRLPLVLKIGPILRFSLPYQRLHGGVSRRRHRVVQ